MLNVREINENDIEKIAKMEKEVFSDAWTVKGIKDTVSQSQAFVLVAEKDQNVVGYCIVYYVLDEGEIARIAVDSSSRRQGVGRKLLDHLCLVCLEKGVFRILLDVRESNLAARTFYLNYGFAEDGIRKNFYERPKEHAVLMSKEIGAGLEEN